MPVWIAVLAVAGICALVLPLLGMGQRVPWTRLPALIGTEAARDALSLSLRTCLSAILIDLLLGVPLALLLARDWRGVRVARVVVLLPLSLPPVVAGIALLATFGRRGLIGARLEAAGVSIAFSTVAVVMAQVFVSLPFLVTTLESAVRTRPWGLEETAAALGAGPSRVLATITLPTMTPALTRGTALAAARCLGEFGATLTFAGSLQGTTRTMPLEIYLARETDSDTALALGLMLVVVGAIVVALTEWTPRRRRRRRGAGVLGAKILGAKAAAPAAAVSPSPADPDEPTSAPSSVRVRGRIRERGWDVDLRVDAGEVIAVMGHNGAGKSTLAGVITGLLGLDSGELRIGGRLVDGAGVLLPPRRRGVALLTQQARIFGHMSVLDNVAYGPRSHGASRERARRIARAELAGAGCLDLAGRRGDELSGGQAARVGLARALAVAPDVLILDEPTAALDVESRAMVQRVLRRRLAATGTTAILITHDVIDAVQVASRLLVMDGGRVVADGSPSALLASPTTGFTARLAGVNMIRGRAQVDSDHLVSVSIGERRLVAVTGSGEETSGAEGAETIAEGDEVALVFAPRTVALHREPVPGSPRTCLPGTVAGVEQSGGLVTVLVTLDSGETIRAQVTIGAWTELGISPGETLWCTIKATQVRAVPAGPAQAGR
ncbi:molybdate ABC transporter permease subunit [Acidipropionibacterium virtanenii]|uniref:molybdate ABC transporter permease subunit n=1 Tax=Acidipropionibacterium virtanenii TaxID=2057246 RepID=UPI00319E4EBC